MKKIKIVVFLFLFLVVLASCSQETKTELFNDHVIDVWANSLEPFSYEYAFFGDSRVAGADWVGEFSNYSVVNLGLGGDVVNGLVRRLKLIKAADVKCCFVAIGGNDCLSNSFDEKTFESQYSLLIQGLKDLGVSVKIMTIAGVTDVGSSLSSSRVSKGNKNISKANEIIKDLASSYEVDLIDMAFLMNNSDGKLKTQYSSDGVHFSEEGNRLWFDTVALNMGY